MTAGKDVLEGRALVFDVSTLVARSSIRPTGIDRVQLETALELIELAPDRVMFCAYNPVERVYDRVSQEVVSRMASRMRGRPLTGASTGSNDLRKGSRLASQLKHFIDTRIEGLPRTRAHVRLTLGYSRRAALEAAKSLTAYRADRLARKRRLNSGCFSSQWGQDTMYCSLGMDFSHNDLSYLRIQREARGFRVAIMVYDLIPVVAPQYATIDLGEYFSNLVDVCDITLVISDATSEDLQRFVDVHGYQRPISVKVPLGSALLALEPVQPSELADLDLNEGFVLAVGTVTLRKNYHLLLDVWKLLIAEYGPNSSPRLIVAGHTGSLSDGEISRMHRDPDLRGVVTHLDRASDSEIAWLYANCTFTVYPSLYEGWGLPVTESLDFGKVCLASDRTSLPEAGGGLAVHLDGVDRIAWHHAIVEYWTNHQLRQKREQEIVSQHVLRTGRDTALAVLGLSHIADEGEGRLVRFGPKNEMRRKT